MRARAISLLATVGAAIVLAACGGGGGDGQERQGYVQALNAAQTSLAQRFTALQKQVTPTSTAAQDARTLSAYEAAVRRTVADLQAVRPPDGFEGLHRQFVAQVGDYGTALRTARVALGRGRPQDILAVQGRLKADVQRTGERLNATVQAINAKLKS
jgi:hypothetical protein